MFRKLFKRKNQSPAPELAPDIRSLPYPEIIEWSKPLSPEQWVKRSPEMEQAIAKREAELATMVEQPLLLERS
ncbi:hypothetical protein [Pseudomonas sp. GL-B-19]|uniref:hypothetical protein n=1 Tax=Pseudomonas sp. GL-B-19 TaxID=2832393 RepID=UPI001CBF6B5A|nr:hypothetical protein [Pseudomonas sp. GL-B-19]